MAGTIWVAELIISPATMQKVDLKHELNVEDVRHAVVCRKGLEYSWDDHELRGLRAIVYATIRTKKVMIVLYPEVPPWLDYVDPTAKAADDLVGLDATSDKIMSYEEHVETWALGSAYVID